VNCILVSGDALFVWVREASLGILIVIWLRDPLNLYDFEGISTG